jgi:uncharacterized protein YkwD
LRKLVTAALCIPVIALIYLGAFVRRSTGTRLAAGLVLVALVGVAVMASAGGTPTTASGPTVPVPLTKAAFTTAVRTDLALDAPITIDFSTPMDAESVAAAIAVDPPAAVELDWDATGRTLTIVPATAWSPDTYHRVTVEAGALARTGRPLARAAQSVFLTRPGTDGAIAALQPAGRRVAVNGAFAIGFERQVEVESVLAAFRIDPPVEGRLEALGGLAAGTSFTFTPTELLAPDTKYVLTVSGVSTADGERLEPLRLAVRTAKAPAVVRFRPRDDSQDVARDASISVRFTEKMSRSTTRKAFRVELDGKAVKGTIRFAEGDEVLVFEPSSRLPYDRKVVVTVATTATSASGTPLAKAARGIFRTEEKPKPKPKAPAAPRSSSGGGAAASGNWGAVEIYYLRLMNCTRTGGWVTSSGSCKSPGGRNVAPLSLSTGISNKVARPYAKLLATRGECTHFIGGNPGDRLRRAGYSSYRWAENLGCRSGDPKKAVLGSHLYFQSEKSYLGGHYVNMMNAKYDRAGIGVWVSGGRVRLVVDFYHP